MRPGAASSLRLHSDAYITVYRRRTYVRYDTVRAQPWYDTALDWRMLRCAQLRLDWPWRNGQRWLDVHVDVVTQCSGHISSASFTSLTRRRPLGLALGLGSATDTPTNAGGRWSRKHRWPFSRHHHHPPVQRVKYTPTYVSLCGLCTEQHWSSWRASVYSRSSSGLSLVNAFHHN